MRKATDTICMICTDQIEYYAIGDCGHNEMCWKCVLKQRLKLLKKDCAMCKQVNYRVLITKHKHMTLDMCQTALYDPETDVSYEDIHVKADMLKRLGFYCQYCTNNENVRKFPHVKQLANHYEQ